MPVGIFGFDGNIIQRAQPDFFFFLWGGVENLRVRGGYPQKLISFDPFVNCFVVILVNFLDYVIFFLHFS